VTFEIVAVIVAFPGATPVTLPVPSTLATDPLLDAQVADSPMIAAPDAFFGVAVSCVVLCTAMFVLGADTVTVATSVD